MNFQMFKMDLEKAEEPEIKANICWIIEKARVPENIYFCFIDYAKAFDGVDHKKCNCEVVGAFFGIAFLWDWNEN